MTEYRIVFKENEDGDLEVFPEVIGEDHTIITIVGDHFYKLIKGNLERLAEELESE